MLIAATRELLTGPPAYHARSPWRPVFAVAAAFAMLGAGAVVATALVGTLDFAPAMEAARQATLPPDEPRTWAMAVWLLGMQATVIVLVVAAAGLFGGRRAEVLALDQSTPARLFVAAVVLMFLVQAAYNAIVLPFARDTVLEDVKPVLEPLRSDAFWLFALVIVVGAPLSEEILFRGFLQSALAQTRLGYFGAALLTTLAWTVLHAGYSGLGLLEVFIAGLFFSWLLWRTGNLWVPLVCHAFYNGVVLLALLVAPI
ncbi:MAG: CPBP family intramembrane metalloprotease [Hyphomicrobiaceae bacterium]|nr:CPBP family intramembrane metalloprotease [Hyphomicrobiaceae bacterium]